MNDELYRARVSSLDAILKTDINTDIVHRSITVAGRQGMLYYIDGLVRDAVLERVLHELQTADSDATEEETYKTALSYAECARCGDSETAADRIFTGCCALVVCGFTDIFILAVRAVPMRGIEEPQNDKVLRGPKIGFVESLSQNTALLRRHIRDRHLRIHTVTVGTETKTPVAVCYLDGKADPERVRRTLRRLSASVTHSVSMGAQSISEILVRQSWWNPFPKFRYTERPDTAAASVLEGSIVILADNSPQAILLPVSIFDFLQQAEDYYMPPAIGTYLKIVRIITFFTGLYLTPVWYLLLQYPDVVPWARSLLSVSDGAAFPIIVQLLLAELAIDGLRLASLNTPDPLTNSLGIVGGLILGDLAIEGGWFLPQTILYAAVVSIANFVQQSYELGYAVKFARCTMLISEWAFGLWGFLGANLLILTALLTNKTVDGKRAYFYPLLPFNGFALSRLLFRRKKHY